MDTIQDALKCATNSPVPQTLLNKICVLRELDLADDFTAIVAASSNYRLAEADVMSWASQAAAVSEGGITINLLPTERIALKRKALGIYKELGDANYINENPVKFGYKGSDL